LVEFILIVVI